MDYIGILFAPLILATALLSIAFTAPAFKINASSTHNAAIDGLRGYAGMLVYICHAASWFYFCRTDQWAAPPVSLYSNLGSGAVILFFMITAFLFTNKLLDAKVRPIDWAQYATSRLLRLAPLYLFSMLVLGLIVAGKTNFSANQPPSLLLQASAQWLLFTLFGSPDINALKDTWLINAGVAWSLKYEVFFYVAYPTFGAILLGSRMPKRWLCVLLGIVAAWYLFTQVRPLFAVPFIGGVIAAVIARQPVLSTWAKSTYGTIAAIAALLGALIAFRLPFGYFPLALYSIFFSIVASGNSLFGMLTWSSARKLGEVSYSIYLLHAILLYLVIECAFGRSIIAATHPATYWLGILVLTPVLILLCSVTFTFIERPAMDRVGSILNLLRKPSNR